jgi:hypothetical protein
MNPICAPPRLSRTAQPRIPAPIRARTESAQCQHRSPRALAQAGTRADPARSGPRHSASARGFSVRPSSPPPLCAPLASAACAASIGLRGIAWPARLQFMMRGGIRSCARAANPGPGFSPPRWTCCQLVLSAVCSPACWLPRRSLPALSATCAQRALSVARTS